MEILAVDDEKIALEGLVRCIKETEQDADVHDFKKASEALEFYESNACEIVFLDIKMRNIDGVELAKKMKCINPKVNIIFTTGFGEYREEAFAMHASGYIIKPVTEKKIREELENLRHPVSKAITKRIKIVTFGNFEVYIDGMPVEFKYALTKEMLAYLVNRNGAYCTNAEIMAVLWEDDVRSSYLSNLKKDLIDTLKEKGCQDLIGTAWGKMRIDTDKVDCDYYDWQMGKIQAINAYRGEYMSQYSWAEFTNASLSNDNR